MSIFPLTSWISNFQINYKRIVSKNNKKVEHTKNLRKRWKIAKTKKAFFAKTAFHCSKFKQTALELNKSISNYLKIATFQIPYFFIYSFFFFHKMLQNK